MTRTWVVAATVAVLARPEPGLAQQRWSLELRGGAAVATQRLGDTELGEGVVVEGAVSYRILPQLAAYAGWDWLRFPSDRSFAGPNRDFEETGYAFGLRFEHPFPGETAGRAYRVRVGGTYNHIEIENSRGLTVADSGHGLGWEIGTSVIVPVWNGWRGTPGVRFRSLGRTLLMGGVSREVSLSYVALEMGLSRRF
jgi:hypothetical protein